MLTRSILMLAGAMIATMACGDNKTTDTRMVENVAMSDSTLTSNFADSLSGCYLMVKNKDTALLKLETQHNKVSGSLEYSIFEKDRNTGELAGEIKDSLIKAYYTFQSEGTTSVREIVFKIKDGKLEEGYAPVMVRNDSAFFAKDSAFTFVDDRPFQKVACEGN